MSTSPRYNDAIDVAPSARSAEIQCSAQLQGDLHCAAVPFRNQYTTGGTFNAIELWGREAWQTERSSLTALYKATVPVQPLPRAVRAVRRQNHAITIIGQATDTLPSRP